MSEGSLLIFQGPFEIDNSRFEIRWSGVVLPGIPALSVELQASSGAILAGCVDVRSTILPDEALERVDQELPGAVEDSILNEYLLRSVWRGLREYVGYFISHECCLPGDVRGGTISVGK